jgi:uncharacterized membrane protein
MVRKLNWRWLFRDMTKQLWFTVASYCLLAIGTALSALVLDPLIPSDVSSQIGADAVDRILGILASSMLAVATFSIATMVQAFAASSNGATPRARQLVVEDRAAQQALATFIGAFVFSLVGLVALSTGVYGPSGRLVLFVVTIIVIVLILVMLLRWIHRLSRLGSLSETIDQVERAAEAALMQCRRSPYLGGRPAIAPPLDASPVHATSVGYITRIDMATLSAMADGIRRDIHVGARPGTFVTLDRPLAMISGVVDQELAGKITACFMISDQRSFEHDPRFGMIVLSEIASRALSPAVNDPGTAIDVIGTIVRLLSGWAAERPDAETLYRRIVVPPLDMASLLRDALSPIARDGAGLVEVCIRLQKGCVALVALGDPVLAAAARQQAEEALARAELGLPFPGDLVRLRKTRLR